MTGLLSVLTRLDTGGIPSLRRSLAEAMDLDYTSLLEEPSLPAPNPIPAQLVAVEDSPVRTQGDLLERLEGLSRSAYNMLNDSDFSNQAVAKTVERLLGANDAQTSRVLNYVTDTLRPALLKTTNEITNLLRGLDGRFVPAGPSGAPTRGMSNILPTGRNFYSVDPKTIPSPTAWEMGVGLADALLKVYLEEEGNYPEMVGLVIWGTSAMRTHGDDIAQVFSLLGVKPVWQEESRRITGLEIIPLSELGRPRIDVTVRISGFFRDAFPNLIELIDEAVQLVAALDEAPEDNMIVKHLQEDKDANESNSTQDDTPTQAQGNPALYRIFGSKPGTYGAGILGAIDERNWETVQDLAEVYTAWGGYAYSRQDFGVHARTEFRRRFGQIVVAAKNQDNREHDIFDSDDYMQYHGGMIATVRALTGQNPQQFFGDSSDPTRARVRKLEDEARRVFRTRVVNPKWIDSMKRHGYKGAFEIAATVDYLFAFAATTGAVKDHHLDAVFDAYIADDNVREFMASANPAALAETAARLGEALRRGLWKPRSNRAHDLLSSLSQATYREAAQ